MNLVVNARDAMPTGGKLTIEVANIELDDNYAARHLTAHAGDYVMLAVTDSGVGMDRETQARVFEPFFTTKAIGQGTGLGLSTVFGIVQQSGGHVWVYSEPDKGTTFKIYLPRVQSQAGAMLPAAPAATLRGTETVLLVEDDSQVRAVALTILRRQGYTVLPAQSDVEAVALCTGHPGTIHLLLTDVVMPRISGPELARQLLKFRPDMKVLFMSGYTGDRIVRHVVMAGELAFVQKPITSDSLGRKVREVLDAVTVGSGH
jgi:CheY-like chemotaxis protein